MDVKSILDEKRVIFGLKADSKEGIIREIANVFVEDGVVEKEDFEQLISDLMEREALSSTGMQEGIAIPHAKSKAAKEVAMAVAIDKEGKDFASMDEEKSTMFFMVVAPESTKREHLDILSLISKLSFEEEKIKELLETNDSNKVMKILESL